MNLEHNFEELKQQLNRLDTTAAQSRIEARLRLALAEQHSTQSTPMHTPTSKRWHWLSYTLGGSSLAALALVTTLVIQPTTPRSSTLSAEQSTFGLMLDSVDAVKNNPAKSYGLSVDSLDDTGLDTTTANSLVAEDAEQIWIEDIGIIEPQPQGANTYTDGDTERQLFDESVSLSVEVKGEMLDAIHTLRDQVSTLNGQLINISYHETSGTIDIKLPADQLGTFEDVLKQLDAQHTVEMNSYNVVNVSEQIVTIDADIASAKETIAQAQRDLTASGITDTERQRIADQITVHENYIAEQEQLRKDTIAEHQLVAVRVVIQKYASFFEGNYYQYDRSTFSGQIKYELGRAMFSLIHNTGKLTTFLVWLLVYSIVLIPVFWCLRWLVRKIIHFFHKL